MFRKQIKVRKISPSVWLCLNYRLGVSHRSLIITRCVGEVVIKSSAHTQKQKVRKMPYFDHSMASTVSKASSSHASSGVTSSSTASSSTSSSSSPSPSSSSSSSNSTSASSKVIRNVPTTSCSSNCRQANVPPKQEEVSKYKCDIDVRKLMFMRQLLQAEVENIRQRNGPLSCQDAKVEYVIYEVDRNHVLVRGANSLLLAARNTDYPTHPVICRRYPSTTIGVDDSLYLKFLRHLGKKHSSIVHTWELFTDADRNVEIFQEYCANGNLQDYVRSRGGAALAEREIALYAWQLLRGLDFLGDIGISHREIHPKNLLLREASGELNMLKIGNFRRAIIYWNVAANDVAMVPCRPAAQQASDGANYQAPEVYGDPKSEDFDPIIADTWSYGAVIYFMASKQYPYDPSTQSTDLESCIQRNVQTALGQIAPLGKALIGDLLKTNANERIPIGFVDRSAWFDEAKKIKVDVTVLSTSANSQRKMDEAGAKTLFTSKLFMNPIAYPDIGVDLGKIQIKYSRKSKSQNSGASSSNSPSAKSNSYSAEISVTCASSSSSASSNASKTSNSSTGSGSVSPDQSRNSVSIVPNASTNKNSKISSKKSKNKPTTKMKKKKKKKTKEKKSVSGKSEVSKSSSKKASTNASPSEAQITANIATSAIAGKTTAKNLSEISKEGGSSPSSKISKKIPPKFSVKMGSNFSKSTASVLLKTKSKSLIFSYAEKKPASKCEDLGITTNAATAQQTTKSNLTTKINESSSSSSKQQQQTKVQVKVSDTTASISANACTNAAATATPVVPQSSSKVSQPSAPVPQPSLKVSQPSAPVSQPSAPVPQPSSKVSQPSAPKSSATTVSLPSASIQKSAIPISSKPASSISKQKSKMTTRSKKAKSTTTTQNSKVANNKSKDQKGISNRSKTVWQ